MLRSHFRVLLSPGLPVSLLALLSLLALAGCGASGGGGLYGTSGSSGSGNNVSAQTTCASSGAAICTRSAQVNGNAETVLVTPAGRTLYYFTADSATNVACTGSCTNNWPPLLSSSANVAAISNLSGTLATINRSGGMQIIYNGHPLYTFAGDKAPGDVKGEGIKGAWYVATPDLAPSGDYNSGY